MDSEYFDIFIHIDRKSEMKIEDIEPCKLSKLYIYKEIKVYWAHFSQVECELFLIKKALEQEEKYDYLHLISGVDFPLKKADEIYDFFNENYGLEFVHFESLELDKIKKEWIKYYRWVKDKDENSFSRKIDYYLVKLQRSLGINRFKKFNIKFYTGTNWFSITDKFGEYVVSKEKWIKKLKYAANIDEIFLQTIIYNSEFKNNLYYKGFDNDYNACKRLLKWVGNKAYVWTMKDLKTIEESDLFFARKFDINTDREIIDYLYEKLI